MQENQESVTILVEALVKNWAEMNEDLSIFNQERIRFNLLSELLITYNQSFAEFAKIYAAIFSVIALAVLFLEVLEVLEKVKLTLFRPDKRGKI